jgi:hypothetical protein
MESIGNVGSVTAGKDRLVDLGRGVDGSGSAGEDGSAAEWIRRERIGAEKQARLAPARLGAVRSGKDCRCRHGRARIGMESKDTVWSGDAGADGSGQELLGVARKDSD